MPTNNPETAPSATSLQANTPEITATASTAETAPPSIAPLVAVIAFDRLVPKRPR